MRKPRKPRKLSKTERAARALRQRLAHERAMPQAGDRERRLRELMGLPARSFSDGTSIGDEP